MARGDISVIREELDELLSDFQLNVDRKSQSYRKLGMAVLTAYVRALRDIERRNAGEPIETPPSACVLPELPTGQQGGTLREAFEGWKKERQRPEGIASSARPRTLNASLRKISFLIFTDLRIPKRSSNSVRSSREEKMSDRRELYRSPNGDAWFIAREPSGPALQRWRTLRTSKRW